MARRRQSYRVVVLGAAASGKTALIRRFVHNEMVQSYDPTVEERYSKSIEYHGETVRLDLLDTSGKELVSDMLARYLEAGDAFLVTYSVGSRRSLQHAVRLFSAIAACRGINTVARVLVGCQCEGDYREVAPEEGRDLSAQLGCSFAETSALANINVIEVFEEVVSQLQYVEMIRKRTQPPKRNDMCCFL